RTAREPPALRLAALRGARGERRRDRLGSARPRRDPSLLRQQGLPALRLPLRLRGRAADAARRPRRGGLRRATRVAEGAALPGRGRDPPALERRHPLDLRGAGLSPAAAAAPPGRRAGAHRRRRAAPARPRGRGRGGGRRAPPRGARLDRRSGRRARLSRAPELLRLRNVRARPRGGAPRAPPPPPPPPPARPPPPPPPPPPPSPAPRRP